ncbi:oxygen-insensitive NADPH nitroreductase [Psychromonas sp. MB-3u-54]|uniref:oxygen-insensitive NADPH nitroreductase n=1 Tax=Psychromonas sp. MB-3u-54 TaxID=2058319 RepID=UPI000C31E084|nr:oxygen-insensitive NADPH nitroreductase [Psychromonas sp. MB-3u-54]PKH02708.1 oxygen-insensitive NADPH nitroreductase [Psychromonas sp. MB-3u-54]
MQDVTHLLQSHRSIRTFKNIPIEQSIVEELIRSGQAAATSSFIQACTVIQISPGAKREKLAALAGHQSYVNKAPVFLVFCADMHRHQLACEMHNVPINGGYTEQLLTTSIDCALFAQNVVIGAEALGLGICYIGGIRNDIAAVSSLLALPDLVFPVFGLCLGYPDQDPEVKPRLPLSLTLKQDSYLQDKTLNQANKDDIAALEVYDQQIREYYKSRTSAQKEISWTEQISGMLQKEARPHMMDFLQGKGFMNK